MVSDAVSGSPIVVRRVNTGEQYFAVFLRKPRAHCIMHCFHWPANFAGTFEATIPSVKTAFGKHDGGDGESPAKNGGRSTDRQTRTDEQTEQTNRKKGKQTDRQTGKQPVKKYCEKGETGFRKTANTRLASRQP